MVDSRVAKLKARKLQSQTGTSYIRARATIMETDDIQFVSGPPQARTPINWKNVSRGQNLSIQGPANSGKTTLLARLASQAVGHADVYAILNGAIKAPHGLKAHANDPQSAWRVLLDVWETIQSKPPKVRDDSGSTLPDIGTLAGLRARMFARTQVAPRVRKSKPAIVFIDDFDVLCRESTLGRSGPYPPGPASLVENLADLGNQAGISVVIAGRSMSLHRLPYRATNSSLLLGPATLAEKEAFFMEQVANFEVGPGQGLYRFRWKDRTRTLHIPDMKLGVADEPPTT
jgi:hypothetical protein